MGLVTMYNAMQLGRKKCTLYKENYDGHNGY